VASAIENFATDTGAPPLSLHELVVKPARPIAWRGPYLAGDTTLTDPWDNPLVYELRADAPGGYRLSSRGPDGVAGTDDDVIFKR